MPLIAALGVYMGITRRKFIKFIGVALAGLTIDPTKAVAVNHNYYINRKLGLGFIKPDSWYFEKFKDFGHLKEGLILSNFDEELAEELKEEVFDDPLAIISKYPASIKVFSPSVVVHLEQYGDMREYTDIDEHDDLLDMIQVVLNGFEILYKDFELLTPPSQMSISECKTWKLVWKYLFEHEDIDPTMVNVVTYFIFSDNGVYSIYLQDSPTTGENARIEFVDFMSSLHIV